MPLFNWITTIVALIACVGGTFLFYRLDQD